MPDNNALSYTMGFDIVSTIAICAYAAVILVLAVLAVAALFKQKKLLAQINNTLIQQGVSASVCAPPAPNTCPKCGSVRVPEAAFCQNCGAAL